MILEMLMTSLAIFAIMGAWVLFQRFVHRHTPDKTDKEDPLSSQFGCSSCELNDSCGISKNHTHKPPVEIRLFD